MSAAAAAVEEMVSRALNFGGRVALYLSGGVLCMGAFKAYSYMHSKKKVPQKKEKSSWFKSR